MYLWVKVHIYMDISFNSYMEKVKKGSLHRKKMTCGIDKEKTERFSDFRT